jgi:GNAT superfamily N-acetyltransferase
MNDNITVQPPTTNCGEVCEPILRALPEWFGIEKSLIQYVKDADSMPTMLVNDGDDVVGFLIIKKHFPESADIHCMGILPKYHRTGTGKVLIHALEKHLKEEGVKILQVKTVSADRDCDAYAKSRAFYYAVGFIPLEVFPTLWDEANPCLLFVKVL